MTTHTELEACLPCLVIGLCQHAQPCDDNNAGKAEMLAKCC